MIIDSEEDKKNLLAILGAHIPGGSMAQINQFSQQIWNPLVTAISESTISVKKKALKEVK